MRRLQRGQSTAEYAVLFAIVIGAAIAVQQYVRGRLSGAVQGYADQYEVLAESKPISIQGQGSNPVPIDIPAVDITAFTGDPGRTSRSESSTDLQLSSSTKGTVDSESTSYSVSGEPPTTTPTTPPPVTPPVTPPTGGGGPDSH